MNQRRQPTIFLRSRLPAAGEVISLSRGEAPTNKKRKDSMSEEIKKKKKDKDNKKEKKLHKRQREEENKVETAAPQESSSSPTSSKSDVKHDRDDDGVASKTKAKNDVPLEPKKQARLKRRQERETLMAKVPKADEHGVAYTKQQIRRMRKRVARGLDPVETAAEEQARLQQEAQLRREEEAELAGMLAEPKRKNDNDEDDGEEGEEEDDDDHDEGGHHDMKEFTKNKNSFEEPDDGQFAYEKKRERDQLQQPPSRKKKKRAKEVPSDYVCSACQNRHKPVHWIYDCPDKRTMRGTNQVAKRRRGLHNPSDCKLFVSGLPFECKAGDVTQLFSNVQNVKLIKFPDTGRCKGQAYLTFASPEDARTALKLNGTTIPNVSPPPSTKKGTIEPKRKELKLKVTKVLNRFQTKHSQK